MTSTPRVLAIMGSGETAPTMVSVHQHLLSRLPKSATAALIETPYGFQGNADEITERTRTYFSHNVGRDIAAVGLRSASDGDDANDIARLQTADYVFAGPGSPTYALEQWRGSAFTDVVKSKLRSGGVVVFASAAAVGLGRFAVPVYEIYKVGQPPHWVEGLDLLNLVGIDAAVIPHYDNAEGGTHDTRFCYLGAHRLERMEQELDDDTVIIGVDEHTALVFDLDDHTAEVRGRGGVTVRRRGRDVRVVPAGQRLTIADLVADDDPARASAGVAASSTAVTSTAATDDEAPGRRTLPEHTHHATVTFEAALAARDVDAAVEAILQLEAAVADWSTDTTQNDETDRARAALRGLIVRLGQAARDGLADPSDRFAPLLDAVVETRAHLRDGRDYARADGLRDAALRSDIELRDTPDGTEWTMR